MAPRIKSQYIVSASSNRQSKKRKVDEAVFNSTEPSTSNSSRTSSNNDGKKRIAQPSISDFGIKTSASMKTKLDDVVATFFYGCNIPFSVIESPHFKTMIETLRPGYKPPNRKTLANDLLDTVSTSVHSKMMMELENKTVTLIQDGWSSIHNVPVIANCISTGEHSYFVSSVDTKAEKKTADYCLQLAVKAKEEVEKTYKCKVRSFVSDNEAKMKKMRQDLEIKYADEYFVSYGSAAHYINLTGTDVSQKNSAILKHVVEVQKYFRNHHKPSAFLKEFEGSVKPQLPCVTRWNSQKVCLETFIKNREFYLKIADEHEEDVEKNILILLIISAFTRRLNIY